MEAIVIALITWVIVFVFKFMEDKYKEKLIVSFVVFGILTVIFVFLLK